MSFLSDALQTAGGAIAGFFPKTSSTSGTQTMTRTTPDALQPLQGDILEQLRRRMQDPSAGIAPLRTAARNNVNANYAGFDQALRDRYATSGGESGKLGTATRQGELSRISSLSSIEPQFAGMILDQGNNNLSLAQRFLQAGQGSNVNSTGKTSSGGGIGGAVSGGLQTLATLFTLNKRLSAQGPQGTGDAW